MGWSATEISRLHFPRWRPSRHLRFGQTGNSAIRSADSENLTLEPKMKWIGRPVAEIWPFEISPHVWGHWSVVGRSSIYTSYTDLMYSSSLRKERSARGVKILKITTRKLCYRKDDRAMRPIYGFPENFRDSLTTTPTVTFPQIFHGLLFQSTCECAYKIWSP